MGRISIGSWRMYYMVIRSQEWSHHEYPIHKALIKETPENSLIPFATWEHSEEMDFDEPGRGFSPDSEPTSVLILDFPRLHNHEK